MFLTENISNEYIKSRIHLWYIINNLGGIKRLGVSGGGVEKNNLFIKDVIYYDKYKFYFHISKETENTILIVISNNTNKFECATIRIDLKDKFSELIGIYGNETCAEPRLPVFGKGKILLKCILDLLKNKLKRLLGKYYVKINYIELSDNSKKHCTNTNKFFTMFMSDFYTLIEGVPWYYKFGFRHIDQIANIDIEKNKQIMDNIKVSDINSKDIIKNSIKNFKNKINIAKNISLEPNIKDIENYNFIKNYKKQLYVYLKERKNDLIKSVIKNLSQNLDGCKLIYCIHEELMKEIGLVSIKSKYPDNNYILSL